jgi:putative ABC transport system permease protein
MQIDREQPIDQVESLEQTLANRFAEPRFETLLMGSFAGVALGLAVLGIYSVHAYAVAQRRHEIGIRMALGASAGGILRLIVGRGMRLTGIGIAMGLAGALALRSVFQSVLFGVSAADPAMLFAAAALLAIVGAAACYVPARQASRINPAIALRLE